MKQDLQMVAVDVHAIEATASRQALEEQEELSHLQTEIEIPDGSLASGVNDVDVKEAERCDEHCEEPAEVHRQEFEKKGDASVDVEHAPAQNEVHNDLVKQS